MCFTSFSRASVKYLHVNPGPEGGVAACRGLAVLPGLGVVSASHDQTLRVWTLSGECVGVLHGHTAIIYRVAATPDGLIASAAEDNTARLWRPDGTLVQSIEHPGQA